MRKDIPLRIREIKEWIRNGRPKSFICRELGCKPETLSYYLTIWGISYKGNRGAKGFKISPKRLSALELAKKEWVNSHKLKLRLLSDGIKKPQCENCLSIKWLGQDIPLELDHIDGNHYNNEINNLRLLCPNCHAMTDTNAGKNINKRSCSPTGSRHNA